MAAVRTDAEWDTLRKQYGKLFVKSVDKGYDSSLTQNLERILISECRTGNDLMKTFYRSICYNACVRGNSETFVKFIDKARDEHDGKMAAFIHRCISSISNQLKDGDDEANKGYRDLVIYIAKHFGSLKVEPGWTWTPEGFE